MTNKKWLCPCDFFRSGQGHHGKVKSQIKDISGRCMFTPNQCP